jgi:UDP-N-acetylmuramate--alanine ligase
MAILKPGLHIHLIGIGGIGLSAIARVLQGWGYRVSGSDQQPSALTQALVAEGITVYAGHRAEHVRGADVIVASSAIPDDNPEIVAGQELGLPVVKREQFLTELTAGKTTIAVAGTHGKTTTSAMIAWILMQAGLDPTFIVGGVLQNLRTNAHAGQGPHFVIEADEYDRAFLGLWPNLAVCTTLEHDHPDIYPTFGEMRQAFVQFADQVSGDGLLIVCGEDAAARELGEHQAGLGRRVETYGLADGWDWLAKGTELGDHATFEVWHRGTRLGTSALQIPGRHNVLNSLAALAATHELGIKFGPAAAALTRFQGTERRFEIKGQVGGVTVVDDYAHHPTEIQATLDAARAKYPGRPIWAVFQPHTYTRTAAMLDDFAAAFGSADHVLVTRIYAAREHDNLGVCGRDIVARMQHSDAQYVASMDDVARSLLESTRPGDVIITLGAGDSYLIGERVLQRLQGRRRRA